MRFSRALGRLMTLVMLSVVYYVVMLPILGLIMVFTEGSAVAPFIRAIF